MVNSFQIVSTLRTEDAFGSTHTTLEVWPQVHWPDQPRRSQSHREHHQGDQAIWQQLALQQLVVLVQHLKIKLAITDIAIPGTDNKTTAPNKTERTEWADYSK